MPAVAAVAPAPVATATTSVVLIDDHLLLADSVAVALAADEQIEVLAVAGTCAEGLSEVERHAPDVCLLDQRLPDGLGTDLLPELHAASPTTKVLLMTGDDSLDLLRQALEGGCVGVIGKGQRAHALHDAVLRAAAGETVLSPRDVRRLLARSGHDGHQLGDDLTPRQRDILRLLTAGLPTADIAAQLFISHATARNHIQAVLTKLGAHSKLEAVTIALRENLLSRP
jgi:DNA-binding NarL/FixJ family response regulator